ncbi:ABC transporter permease [Micromonospora carbonacea]|uniref:ABC transporter permease n=1 Tax=Micromonospora carbonacea TaxID=47853 RepID=A0A7H8XLY1_9ACTN|nr:ABC transporter permease [Micromonospora carbonacea]MBB5826925.1 NitT/TauT family transport system permease protein [Micromonospora carbonacea]QLD25239.1 ABC transporter permease [Micromonospora carbonacea]
MDIARRGRPVALGALGVATVLVAWQLIRVTDTLPENSLPGPIPVLRNLPGLLVSAEFRSGLLDTLWTWALALGLATVAGVLVGALSKAIPGLAAPTSVAVDAFRSVPSTALIPIFILLLGLGTGMKMAVAVYAIVWPILINTIYGLSGVEPTRIDAARSMRFSWLRTQLVVALPSALPSIFTGVRIASGAALVVVISTELLGALNGVGTVLVAYQRAGRADYVIAGTLIVGVVGVFVYAAITWLEDHIVKWKSVD